MFTLKEISRRQFLGVASVLSGATLGFFSLRKRKPIPPLRDSAVKTTTEQAPNPVLANEEVTLPPPRLESPFSLEEALTARRSVRTYSEEVLTWENISQLLWAAQGITDPGGKRTAPSAGALYPLETYVATGEGFYHYQPLQHVLSVKSEEDLRPALYEAALRQSAVLHAPAVFVTTAVYARTEAKYGRQRSPRYVHMEAGHAAQNILLQAVALGLGAVPIGAFYDDQVQIALSLPQDQAPLYLIPVGHPQL